MLGALEAMRQTMSWTDERIELLKTYWRQGLSASQIADNLGGITRNAVIGKAHRLGLKARPSPVKPAPAVAKPEPKPKPVKEKPRRVTLLDLTERMCKWPLGHPGEADFHFCGERAEPGQPYCADHCRRAYQTPAPRRDRNRSGRT